jgi:4-hydroxybenzoate polyprenyltransferase
MNLMAWFRIIRVNNLLIIFLTQLLAWGCVIAPSGHQLLGIANFLCISLSTVLIAAAGYIINDYFDIKIDLINRPEKVVLEKSIPLRQAIFAHVVLSLAALLLAGMVARQAHHYAWLSLQAVCTFLLWLYSAYFKRRFLIGNVLISILTALTIITLIVYEPWLYPYLHLGFTVDGNINPVWVLWFYAYFALMLTWIREIVKDMEDYKGDAEQGCVTMPIRWGLKRTSVFVQILATVTQVSLLVACVACVAGGWWLLGLYVAAALIVQLLRWQLFFSKGASSEHYHKASAYLKIIMLAGVGSLVIYLFTSVYK